MGGFVHLLTSLHCRRRKHFALHWQLHPFFRFSFFYSFCLPRLCPLASAARLGLLNCAKLPVHQREVYCVCFCNARMQ